MWTAFLLPKSASRAYNRNIMETNTPNTPQQPLSKKQQRRLAKQQAKQERQAGQVVKSIGSRIAFWVIILAILGFFVYAIAQLATDTPSIDGLPTDVALVADDHILGNPNANVQLIEYADFQCPGCAAFHPLVNQIVGEYKDKIAYTYRHFPLPQHQHAKIMARASEAAANQGKFWEMYDLIYTNQTRWSLLTSVDKTISDYATQLKLDTAKFETDIDAKATKDAVEADYQSGVRYKVNSTPTFFLNGVKMPLPRNMDEFRALITNAIEAASSSPTTDVAN